MTTFRLAATAAAVATAAATLAAAGPSTAAAGPGISSPVPSLTWRRCASSSYPTLQCSSVKVPVDYADPGGRKITLALSRVPHTGTGYQGPLLVNPGGPGGSGLDLAGYVASALPAKVAARYDIIGFDPRGVGASEPAFDCKPGHFSPVRPDPVPRGAREEAENLRLARSFAQACGAKYGTLLRHVNTVNAARDMDAIRAAVGAGSISYFGYSYGTYLGAVYGKLYPGRVRRLVLDSIVDPRGVWYDNNLTQDYAFDARHKAFMAWVARHDAVYRLGTDPARIEARWYAMRDRLREHPAGGRVGPGELEDSFIPGGYYNGFWPQMAAAFSSYANGGEESPIVGLYENLAAVDASGDNGYSVYASVQCQDVSWPRDWRTWHRDTVRTHAKAPFLAWNNAWYNAPCAFWPTGPLKPVDVANDKLPPALLLQATDDAATPYEGGVALHRMLGRSRLVVEEGGGNHGISLSGNTCLDRYLSRYLATGELPASRPGPDATCAALPDPEPARRPARAPVARPLSGAAGRAGALHRLVGFLK